MILGQLEPKDVFTYFEALTKIPHESGNEAEISQYLVDFAKEHQLEVIQEPCYNVIIKKPATPGYESAPGVILQGHMDMVCVKEDDLDFDFATQALPIVVDGDWIRTEGTTLGADNGIAVAMSMAILADKTLEHPALTVLITTAEETGMDGVLALNPENVSGEILLNLDSDNEGEALVSCAGGVRNVLTLPLAWTEVAGASYEIVISGLKGGHSGVEINEGRANANKLMGRLLYELQSLDLSISQLSGGEKDNAISKRAVTNVVISEDNSEALVQKIKAFEELIQKEFSVTDPGIKVSLTKTDKVTKVLTKETAKKAVSILSLIPYGPQTMSANIQGLVESSTNPGVVEMTEEALIFHSAIRSSVKSLKEEINHRIQTLADLTGASMKLISDYPEWTFAEKSKIREIMISVYKDLTGKELKIEAIHAGLECGFLAEKLGDIDMISFGPNMVDIHTPKEALNISSTARTYKFLCEILKTIKG